MPQISVTAVYATAATCQSWQLNLPMGTPLQKALDLLQTEHQVPAAILGLACGVNNESVANEYILRDQDRIAFYRPLLATPVAKRFAKLKPYVRKF